MKFVNRLLFIFLPPLLSAGAILVMMWNYAGWWDCSHYDCMLDELHLHHMRVAGDECINKSPEDFVFIVNSDLSMVWQLSMSKISLEGLLDLCSCEGGRENCCRTRLFFCWMRGLQNTKSRSCYNESLMWLGIGSTSLDCVLAGLLTRSGSQCCVRRECPVMPVVGLALNGVAFPWT